MLAAISIQRGVSSWPREKESTVSAFTSSKFTTGRRYKYGEHLKRIGQQLFLHKIPSLLLPHSSFHSIISPIPLRWVWFSTAGQWFQPSQVIRTWPEKLPPMPAWWWWSEGTRLTSNWRGGTWWEGGSTPLSPGFLCSPCRLGWGRMGSCVLVIVEGTEGREGYRTKVVLGRVLFDGKEEASMDPHWSRERQQTAWMHLHMKLSIHSAPNNPECNFHFPFTIMAFHSYFILYCVVYACLNQVSTCQMIFVFCFFSPSMHEKQSNKSQWQ